MPRPLALYIATSLDGYIAKPGDDLSFLSVVENTGELGKLVRGLKAQDGKIIFCDGGAGVANALLRQNLIDEFIISVIPVLVGDGIRLFQNERPELDLELLSAKSYDTGLVQIHYRKK